jgi:hypothetical protein
VTLTPEITNPTPFLSADKAEQDIGTLTPPLNTPNTPPVQFAPTPEYVEQPENLSKAGSLSAEAVAGHYEAAVKEIEAMGAELMEAARRCEAMTADVHKAISFMQGTATAYREEAKQMFDRIQDGALLTEDVRKMCERVRNRIAADPA